jgi:hypothetical protein
VIQDVSNKNVKCGRLREETTMMNCRRSHIDEIVGAAGQNTVDMLTGFSPTGIPLDITDTTQGAIRFQSPPQIMSSLPQLRHPNPTAQVNDEGD